MTTTSTRGLNVIIMAQQFGEVIKRGNVTIHLYELDDGGWVVADQAGWLPGSFTTRDEALASALAANGLT